MHPAALPQHSMPGAELLLLKSCEHDKSVFLCIVEALIERASCVGELLKPGAALSQCVSEQFKPFNRIRRTIGAGACGKSLGALFDQLAHRTFYSRPILFLFGGKL